MTAPTPLSPAARRAAAGLAVTQLVGWGTTYYVPSVLAEPLMRDLGLSRELVFGGITIMLLVGAAAAPRAGTIMDRGGVRGCLALGSCLMALALVALSLSAGAVSYALAWVVVGAAMPLALTQGALAALVVVAGANARRAFGLMLLMSGFSASVFWPLGAWLEGALGWRATCLVFAGLNLTLCLPLHLLVTSSRFQGAGETGAGAPEAPAAGSVPAHRRRGALVLCALAFSVQGFVSWGLPLNLVEIFKAYGQPAATAVALAALFGPAQVAARIGETVLGPRLGLMTVAVASTVLAPFATALPLVAGGDAAVLALFLVGFGLSAGALTILRAVVPLALFGRAGYAALIGRLSVPQNVAFAIAPVAFAATLDAHGGAGAMWLALGGTLVALAAMLALAAAARAGDEKS